MRKPSGLAILTLIVAAFSVALTVNAQSSKNASVNLSEAERALVAGSRLAIVRTGLSAAYFDQHFTVIKVINQPGDRRIIWKFTVNDYTTYVSDVLGYYTKDGKRVDTHSVDATLRATSEIKRTISRKKANRIMQGCIGRFANPSVEYRASGDSRAALVLNAEAVPKSRPREEPKPSATPTPQISSDGDVIRQKGKKPPPIIAGSVDLESGKCTKGVLQSGAPGPTSRF